jgi:N-methylhydantoinase B/oxoprolinase/acetone carboxylase alpha subunit
LGGSGLKREGVGGGKSGHITELKLIRAGGESEELKTLEGSIELTKGDQILIRGAGGAGFGAKSDDSS